jgi:hypothetical protein
MVMTIPITLALLLVHQQVLTPSALEALFGSNTMMVIAEHIYKIQDFSVFKHEHKIWRYD